MIADLARGRPAQDVRGVDSSNECQVMAVFLLEELQVLSIKMGLDSLPRIEPDIDQIGKNIGYLATGVHKREEPS